MLNSTCIYNLLRFILENGFKKQRLFIQNKFLNNISPGAKILDLGCGTGTYTDLLSRRNYIGLEINPVYIKYATRCGKGAFIRADACRLPFKNEIFDAVCVIATFHHLSDIEFIEVLKEVERTILPKGLFLIMDQSNIKVNFIFNWLFDLIRYFDKGKFIRKPKENLDIVLTEPGFRLVDNWTFVNGLFTYQAILMKKDG